MTESSRYSLDQVLNEKYQARKALDDRFSIRAFAGELGINHSTLTQIMKLKRPITVDHIRNLSGKLGLSREQIVSLIEHHTQDRAAISLETITDTAFRGINDWRYDAIADFLNGSAVTDVDLDQVAKLLRLTREEFDRYFEYLKIHQLLTIEDGKYVDHFEYASNISKLFDSSEESKAYQETLLETSMEAIRDVDPTDRNHTSIILPIDVDDLPALVQFLKKSRQSIAANFHRPESPKRALYALQISLFPLETLKA